DVAEMLVRFAVDDSNLAIVLACVPAAVADIERLRVGIVGDAVGAQVELDGIEQFESVTAEDTEHSVVAAGHDQFVERLHIRDTLRLLEPEDALYPLSRLQINHFYGAILE